MSRSVTGRPARAAGSRVVASARTSSGALWENRAVLPDYWIEWSPPRPDGDTEAAVDEFVRLVRASAAGHLLDVDAFLREWPVVTRWQFLAGVADRYPMAFHGTGDPHIASFEPREPVDFAPFGNQKAVFATSDPIWAMFYAVVDRDRYPLTLNNGCIVLLDAEGGADATSYYFSVSRWALPQRPWRTGHLYLLPRESFVEQPAGTYAGHAARVPQLASPVVVAPFARLEVAPGDFPFLAHVRGHDDERLAEYAQAVMSAGPWPD
jgi:hypothetical protein